MMDRDKMLQWQARESERNRRYRIIELVLVIITIGAVLIAAFIERGGQPIINNYITPSTAGAAENQR